MRAAIAPSPTIGKKNPPLSSTEEAIKLTLAAMLLTATSAPSRGIIFGAATRAKAGVDTVGRTEKKRQYVREPDTTKFHVVFVQ
jgi:hypothetical protein